MAANTSIPDEFGEYDDWIELYNGGSAPVNLNGYYLSDDPANPLAFQVDTAVVVQPGGFVLLWADNDEVQGAFHLGFKLSAGGEQVILTSPLGTTVDVVSFSAQADDISYGRFPDGSSSFFLYTTPTPGFANTSSGNVDKVANPAFGFAGGFYQNSLMLELASSTPGASIYYTLDGKDPSQNSSLYAGPIAIDASTIVRARAFKANYLSSDIISNGYFLNENYSLPLISVVTDPDNMFGPNGIYTNPTQDGPDWERYCQVQYFKNNQLEFNIDCGIRIQGSSSVTLPKKSFRLFFDADYGQDRLEYPMFDGSEVTDFKNLVLRGGYDDDITIGNGTLLRDPLGNRTYQASGGFSTQGNWAILTINGEFWGIYEVRESVNEEFIQSHKGWGDFDLIRFSKYEPELKFGTWDDWDYLRSFLENNDFADEANYEQAKALIDMDNLVNTLAFTHCASYSTWSYGLSAFKEKVPGGQWKYTVWDMDKTHFEQGWNPHDDYANTTGDLTWANFINKALTQNGSFRNKLVNRVADLLNTLYLPQAASETLNGIKAEIEAEIPREYQRWNPTHNIDNWEHNIDKVHTFLNLRPDSVRTYIVDYYGFPGTNEIELDITGQGSIKISTIDVASFPWSGIYFEGVPVKITAIAAEGYIFSGWSDPNLPNEPVIETTWDNNYELTAHFTLGSTAVAPVIINEINYNSLATSESGDWIELFNASGTPVDISGWYFKDESAGHFGIPANTILPANGYLVLAEDSALFQSIFPAVSNFIGNFGNSPTSSFKLGNNGELIGISNANGTYADFVEYDNKLPWPEAADGQGPSLQLISPQLENGLASSWKAEAPTPGAVNTLLLPQTIDIQDIPHQLTTAPPFDVFASASSGLPVSLEIVSGPASILGNTITLDGVPGTVVLQAEQLGDAVFGPALSIQKTFLVTETILISQTVDFAPLPDKLTTDPPFDLTATASSGLPVSFSIVAGPASVSGNTVTLQGVAGTVTVRAEQPGNTDYYPAPSVVQSFEVLQSGQSIDFMPISDKLTTDLPFDLTATASSGLPVSFSIVAGPASVSGNTVTLEGVAGIVTVRAEQPGDTDYSPAPSVEHSFEVLQSGQSIDFMPISDKLTTDLPFDLTATASSGLPVSFSIVAGPASVSGNTVTLEGVAGTVTVRAEQPGSAAYLPALDVEQSFVVTLFDLAGEEQGLIPMLKVFPSPVGHWLHVKIDKKPVGNFDLLVHNAFGQLVKSLRLEGNLSEYSIDVADLADGIYSLTYLHSSRQSSVRFVKSGK